MFAKSLISKKSFILKIFEPFLSADSFSSALLLRLEEDGDEDGDEDDGDGDFFQKFGKERKYLLTDLIWRST